MQTEQLQNFNERLSQWVANQGFWFQIRYSMLDSGMKGRAMFHLLRLGTRFLIFLLILTIGMWVFLVKRTDSGRFKLAFKEQLQAGLSAKQFEIRGLNRVQGQLEISRLAAEGGSETFFTELEARNIRCKMGLVDGLVGIWNPGVISIARMNIDLRAGADDTESAAKLADALFRKPHGIAANGYEVANATLHWGYSEKTQGAIESSVLKMQRTETGWRMNFKGGLFHQNWLRNFEIVHLVVLCEPNGIVFETAELKQDGGTVDFSGLRVIGGERPEVRGVAKIRNIALEQILPPALRSFIEGSISGDFDVFGSTNTSDGIGFKGQVVMDGNNVVSLRERIHLLKALSVVDYSRNYHRIDFREGSFQMKTHASTLELSEVNLKAEDLFTLEGNLKVRLPTPEEAQAATEKNVVAGGSPLYSGVDESSGLLPSGDSDFSLKRAAMEAKRIQSGTQSLESVNLFDRLSMSLELRRLQSQASERMSRMLQYEGMFRVTIPKDAFERAPGLRQLYPVNSTSNRISMRVPIEGNLYELTLKQAEDIYQQGHR